MKICDKCVGLSVATRQVLLVEDDVMYDLCEKHADEVSKFIAAKKEEKKGFFGGKKKNSVKAG